MSQFIIESSKLIKGIIFSPVNELNRVKEGLISKKIINYVIILTMLLTLAKVPFREWGRMGEGLPMRYLRDIVNFISHPLVLWGLAYSLYFCSIFIMIKLCNLFSRKGSCNDLPRLVMSVSAIGIVAHVIFFPLNYLIPFDILMYLGMIFRLWNLVLIFLAVKVSSSLSNKKSILIVVIPVLIMAVFTFGIGTFLDPYLFFLF
jgi:ACR3 family arsenite efflux pump ArsB